MKKTTAPSIRSNTTNNKKTNSLLAARRKVKAPQPTETERLLAKVLDGKGTKTLPKKRSKSTSIGASSARPATASASAVEVPQGWSKLSSSATRSASHNVFQVGGKPAHASGFGAKNKGLSSITALLNKNNTNTNPLKRKRPSIPPVNSKVAKIPLVKKNKVATAFATSTKSEHGKENPATKPASHYNTKPQAATTLNPYTKSNLNNHKKAGSKNSQLSCPSSSNRLEENAETATDSTRKPQIDQFNTSKPTDTTLATVQSTVRQDPDSSPQESAKLSSSTSTTNPPHLEATNDHDAGTTMQLSLNLPISRPQRRKMERSLLTVDPSMASTEPKKDAALQVLGALLSSVTANAKTANIPKSTASSQPSTTTTTTSTILPLTAAIYDAQIDHRMTTDKPVRLLPPMKPLLPPATANKEGEPSTTTTTNKPLARKKPPANNDNFVRQNLRNSAGACRGARNKKRPSKWDKYKKGNNTYGYGKGNYNKNRDNHDDDATQDRRPPQKEVIQRAETFRAGVDPLDDYLDGTLKTTTTTTTTTQQKSPPTAAHEAVPAAPQCTRHQRPCKLLVVKKTATGNKGRKFYCCAMPRGEQCDHFQWADDTVEAAKYALLKNSSHSGFMARQVAAYSERFKKLTVPELREATKRRKLDSTGKKQQLLFRLSKWVRDELASVAPKEVDDNKEEEPAVNKEQPDETSKDSDSSPLVDTGCLDVSGLGDDNLDENDENCDSQSDGSSSEDELEFFDTAPQKSTKTKGALSKVSSKSGRKKDDNDEEEDGFSDTDSIQSEKSVLDVPTNPIEAALFTLFGYRHIKEGQEWAINRCLQKKKSLLVAPTGFGKSMCYVLPAHLMDGICIVVSPLISLIQDQLRELPPRVPAATLSGSLTTAATAAIVDDIIRKRIKVLFVSPERMASASFQRLFQPKWNPDTKTRERPFPTVSLLCVDEAHCLSQWGHNFRPSYLRLRSLMHKIAPQSVLAITATAGHQVIEDICRTLGIEKSMSVVDGPDPQSGSTEVATANPGGLWTMKTDRENIDVKSFMVGSQELRLSMVSNCSLAAE